MALYEDSPLDPAYIQSLLDRAGGAPKRSLWQSVTQPVKALFGVTGNVGGQLAGALAPDLYEEALKRNLEAEAAARGVAPEALTSLEQGEALPGLGDVLTSADIFQDSAPGRVVGHVAGLAGNILGDPTTYLGGAGALSKISAIRKIGQGAEAAGVLERLALRPGLTSRAVEAAGAALAGGRTGEAFLKGAGALIDAPFGPLAALAYAPELIQGTTQPLGQAFTHATKGETGPALEELAKSALTATMAGLVARGIYSDAQAARLIKDFHTPVPTPDVAAAQVAQTNPELIPALTPETAPPLGTPADLGRAFPQQPAQGGFTRQAPVTLPQPVRGEGFPGQPQVRSLGTTEQALTAGPATEGPGIGQPQGGVSPQAKLDAEALPGQAAPSAVSPLAQNAPPALQAPATAMPEAPMGVGAAQEVTPPQAAPQQPTVAGLEGMAANDLQAYLTAKGSGSESSQDTYRGRNATGKSLGLKLGDKAARRVSGAVKSAKEALKNGTGEGLPPLARAIYDDLSGGQTQAETQVAAPQMQPAVEAEVAPTPTPAAPEASTGAPSRTPSFASLKDTPTGQALAKLFATEAPVEAPAQKAPQAAQEAPREAITPEVGEEPTSADIRGKVGSQVLGAQTPSERALTLPQAEASQAEAVKVSSEKQSQWAQEMKSTGTVLAPEELAQATEAQRRALSILHGATIAADGKVTPGDPKRAPINTLLARARRAITDKRIAENVDVELQNTLERSLLKINEKGDEVAAWLAKHPGKSPEQAVQALLAPAFSLAVRGRLRSREAAKVDQGASIEGMTQALEGADAESQARFLADNRINENTLIDSAESADALHELLGKAAKGLRVEGKPAAQWMLDAAVEIGAPPDRVARGTRTEVDAYNQKLKAFLDANAVGVDVSRAKNILRQVADGLASGIELERGRRQKRSMTSAPADVAEQRVVMDRAEARLSDLEKPTKETFEALADMAQVATRVGTITQGRPGVRRALELDTNLKTLAEGTGAKLTAGASDLDKLRAIAGALAERAGEDRPGAAILDDILKRRQAQEQVVHRGLADTGRLPWEGEKWDGLQVNPTDKNLFRYTSGKANLYGRVIRHSTNEPFRVSVDADDGKEHNSHPSARSIPALEALAAEAYSKGQTEIHVDKDWFGGGRGAGAREIRAERAGPEVWQRVTDAEGSRDVFAGTRLGPDAPVPALGSTVGGRALGHDRFSALLEPDPDAPVRLTLLPELDPDHYRFRIEAGESPSRPSGPVQGSILDRLSRAAEKARQDNQSLMREARATAGGGLPDPTVLARLITNHALITADLIAKGGVRFAEWAKTLPEELKAHAQDIWARANAHLQRRELAATGTEGRAETVPMPAPGPSLADEVAQKVAEAAPLPARKAIKPIKDSMPNIAAEALPRPDVAIPETRPGAAPPGEDSYLNTHRNVLPKDALRDGVQLGRALYAHLDRNQRQKWSQVSKEAFSRFGQEDAEEFIARVQKAGGAKDPATVDHMRKLHSRYLADLTKSKDAYFQALGTGDGEAIKSAQQSYIDQVTKTSLVAVVAANDATNTARMLRVRGMMVGALDPKQLKLNRLKSGLERMLTTDGADSKKAAELAELLTGEFEKGDYQGILDAVKNHNKSSLGDMAVEWLKASLMGPASMGAMGISNTLFEGLRHPERALGAGLDKALTALGIQGERAYVMPAVGMLAHAKKNAFREGWKQMVGDVYSMLRAEGLELRPEDFLSAAENDFRHLGGGAIPGKAGELIRNTLKGASALDRYAKIQAKHQESMWEAYNRAFKEGKRGAELEKAAYEGYNELVTAAMDIHHPDHGAMLSKWKEPLNRIWQEMDQDTFQAPVGPDTLLGAVSKTLGKHKATALIVPFRNTPINVFLETVRRTPLGFLTAVKRAKENGVPIGKELAKPLLGTALMGMLYGLAEGGDITGAGPLDPEQQAALKETGWQPYSFKLGDQFISYGRLEPISSLLGIAADAAEGMRRGDFSKVSSSLERGAAIVAENLTNKTFMQGIEGFFSAYSDPSRYGERFLKGLVGTVIPNSIMGIPFGVAARAVDPVYRQTTLLNAAQAKIPGLSQDLPAQTSPTGEVRTRPGSVLERLLSPFSRSEVRKTATARVAAEMDRIGFPIRPPRRFENIAGLRVEYTREEYEKLRAAQMRATEKMSQLLKDPTYQRLPDNELDPRYRLNAKTKEDVLRRTYQQALRPVKAEFAPRLDREAKAMISQRVRQVPVLSMSEYGG